MDFNSFTILSKKAAQLTIPHLRAAEKGGNAPVVKIKNTLASTIVTRIKGAIHTITAPGRAFLGLFR